MRRPIKRSETDCVKRSAGALFGSLAADGYALSTTSFNTRGVVGPSLHIIEELLDLRSPGAQDIVRGKTAVDLDLSIEVFEILRIPLFVGI
jgi:hypothetical protein